MKQTISGILLMTAVLFSVCPAVGSTVEAEKKTERPATRKMPPVSPRTRINILLAGEQYEFSFKLYAEKIADEQSIPSVPVKDVRDFALALAEAHRIKAQQNG